jgi:hypothetical protein
MALILRSLLFDVGLLVGLVGLPILSVVLPGRRIPWWTCAALLWIGLFAADMALAKSDHREDAVLASLMAATIFPYAPWLLFWGWIGRRRARSRAVATAARH